MSIWSELWTVSTHDNGEVSAHTSYTGTLRLTVAEDENWVVSADTEITRAQARDLAQRLLAWADQPLTSDDEPYRA